MLSLPLFSSPSRGSQEQPGIWEHKAQQGREDWYQPDKDRGLGELHTGSCALLRPRSAAAARDGLEDCATSIAMLCPTPCRVVSGAGAWRPMQERGCCAMLAASAPGTVAEKPWSLTCAC